MYCILHLNLCAKLLKNIHICKYNKFTHVDLRRFTFENRIKRELTHQYSNTCAYIDHCKIYTYSNNLYICNSYADY